MSEFSKARDLRTWINCATFQGAVIDRLTKHRIFNVHIMSKQVRYTVTAVISKSEVLPEYIAWLNAGHAQALIDAGALSAEVSVLEVGQNEEIKAEASYVFPSRESLQAYFDGPAQLLREDGKVRWMDTGKISFSRRIATIELAL